MERFWISTLLAEMSLFCFQVSCFVLRELCVLLSICYNINDAVDGFN